MIWVLDVGTGSEEKRVSHLRNNKKKGHGHMAAICALRQLRFMPSMGANPDSQPDPLQ